MLIPVLFKWSKKSEWDMVIKTDGVWVLFCLVVLVLVFFFFFTQARSLVLLPKNLTIETVKNELL